MTHNLFYLKKFMIHRLDLYQEVYDTQFVLSHEVNRTQFIVLSKEVHTSDFSSQEVHVVVFHLAELLHIGFVAL